MIGEMAVGYIYEVHPAAAKKYGLENRAAVLELDLDIFSEALLSVDAMKYVRLPVYPEVERDLAFVLDKKYSHAEMSKVLTEIDSLIKSVDLFDVYEGSNLPTGKKSVAYRLIIADVEKTLGSAEVDKVVAKAIKAMEKNFGAEVRG